MQRQIGDPGVAIASEKECRGNTQQKQARRGGWAVVDGATHVLGCNRADVLGVWIWRSTTYFTLE